MLSAKVDLVVKGVIDREFEPSNLINFFHQFQKVFSVTILAILPLVLVLS